MSLKKAIAAVVGSYSQLLPPKGDLRCSWAMWSDDGLHYTEHLARICHSEVGNVWTLTVESNKYDNCVTSYQATSVMWFTWFDFLVGYLFKQWAHLFHLEKTLKGHWCIHIEKLDQIPANVFYNFLIFTRVPWEFPDNVKQWEGFVKKGVHPCFAFAMCKSTIDVDGVIIEVDDAGNSNHWPIENTVSLETLVSCKPKSLSENYKSNPSGSRPCNVIWGTTLDLKSAPGQTVEAFWSNWKAKHEDILLAS